MSSYLGFQPTQNQNYYFISYNNEDADRVGPIAQKMANSGVALWYDHGIDYGSDWETVITDRIQNAQAVILFFTRKILPKSNSYVQKEYKIATEFFGKKVFVVMMDQIQKDEVPVEKVAWWMSICEKQCITGYNDTPPALLAQDIIDALQGKQRRGNAHASPAVRKQAPKSKRKGCSAAIIAAVIAAPLLFSIGVTGALALSKAITNGFPALKELFGSQLPDSDSTDDDPFIDPSEQSSGDVIFIPSTPGGEDDQGDTYTVSVYTTVKDSYESIAEGVFDHPTDRQFKSGDSVTVSVQPLDGFNFEGWYQNDELVSADRSYTFTMQACEVILEARFSCYVIDTMTNDQYAGTYTVYDEEKTSAGKEITLTAQANEGYNFEGWYNTESGALLTKEPTYTHVMQKKNAYLEARFSYYTVTTSDSWYDEADSGTYTKLHEKKISVGTAVTLEAIPNEGYNFEGWYIDGTDILFSKDAACTFTMKAENITLCARFSCYTVTTSGYTFEGMAGSYTSYQSQNVSVGKAVELTATVQNGYTFEGWYRDGICVSTELTYTFTMPDSHVYLEARYSRYTLTVYMDNYEGIAGTITRYHETIVAVGEQVTLNATVNDGFNFEGWYIGDVCLSKNPSFTYTMRNQDTEIRAQFSYYTVTTSGYDYEGMAGTFTKYQDHRVSTGKNVTLTATAFAGYVFEGWYIDGLRVSYAPTYTFEMPGHSIYAEARFSPINTSEK